jgi:ABC-type bacteriocin/lantibiotic exporter with double-glycine peptidase domain
MKKLVIARLEFENNTATKIVALVAIAFFCVAMLLLFLYSFWLITFVMFAIPFLFLLLMPLEIIRRFFMNHRQ